MKKWYVEAEAVSANSTVPSGALVIFVACNESREEVSRVAFLREHSKHPKASFTTQLRREMKKAEESAETMNTHGKKAGQLA